MVENRCAGATLTPDSVIGKSPAASPPIAERPALAASPRLFANPVLDKLSRTHHLVPLLAYLPAVVVLVWYARMHLSWPAIAAGAVGGYVYWTLVEYFGHRFGFHLELPGPLGARLHYLMHGVHHEHPDDKLRLVMPPLMSLPIILLTAPVLWVACGIDLALPVYAGFIAGYIGYDTAHYHLHHGRPRTGPGRALRRWHLRHHFEDATRGFGVSAPWWDFVFGTTPRRKAS